MEQTPILHDDVLRRIAQSLEHIANALKAREEGPPQPAFGAASAYHWEAATQVLRPVPVVNRVPLDLLKGVDALRDLLLENTRQFARGHGANNALLWGARGMGKSSLVKAVHADVAAQTEAQGARLILVEINREDIESLPLLMRTLAAAPARVILFCDDLSFDRDETSYKSLKSVLDGGLEGRPPNVIFYATSTRRHLMPRDMIDNERASAINPGDAVDEKISLSDRFGLWLGFHNCDQDTYLDMVASYAAFYGLPDVPDLRAQALEWSLTRGARSGRVAIQFVRHLAGSLGRAV